MMYVLSMNSSKLSAASASAARAADDAVPTLGLSPRFLSRLIFSRCFFPVRREAKFFSVAPEDGGAGTNTRRAAEDVVEIWDLILQFHKPVSASEVEFTRGSNFKF